VLDSGFSATSSAEIFDDCKLLNFGFRDITFKHCNREANIGAHELARYSFIQHFDSFWDDVPPRFLLPKLINDVTVFEI
jgi:hypothetical protein